MPDCVCVVLVAALDSKISSEEIAALRFFSLLATKLFSAAVQSRNISSLFPDQTAQRSAAGSPFYSNSVIFLNDLLSFPVEPGLINLTVNLTIWQNLYRTDRNRQTQELQEGFVYYRSGSQTEQYVHLQDHDDIGLALERVNTLDQFGVMEAVHDADLLPDVLLLLGWVRLDELSRPNLLGGLLHQFEDLTELSPETQTTQALQRNSRTQTQNSS